MKLRNSILVAMIVATGAVIAANGINDTTSFAAIATTVAQLARVLFPSLASYTLAGYADLAAADGDPEAVAKELSRVVSDFKSAREDFGKLGTEFKEKIERGEKSFEKLREDFDKQATTMNALKANMEELEQKAIAATKNESAGRKSWGQQIVDHENFKEFKGAEGARSSFRVEVKQIDTVAAGGAAGSGLMTPAYRDGDLVELPRTQLTIEDLLPSININSSSVDYVKQKTRTNNAAMVAESAQKPYSEYAWESASVNVRTVAHLAKLTRQALEDAPRLVGEVDSEMRYGLGLIKEVQILNGNGTGQNLHGIIPQATDFVMPTGITAASIKFFNRVDVLRLAMLNVVQRGYAVDGQVLNPYDWALIELLKDENGSYLFSRPQGGLITASMWGQPVVATPAMAQGDFLVGGFRIGATKYRRMGVEVLISTENDKDFEFNLATMRAEERLALAVKRPGAFETGTFDTIITPPSGG